MAFLGVVLVGGFFTLGLQETLGEKIDYYSNGFDNALNGTGTLAVRLDNWQLLFTEWGDNINLVNLLFGHGLASSREIMFYLSVQRGWSLGNLVQTAHNSYIEFFYDYGFVSLFYFVTYLVLIRNYWQALCNAKYGSIPRYFALSGLSLILFLGVYGLTDGIRVPMQIQQFAL
ncbi:MAG: hypothetical protein AAGI66_05630, partial [Cyanobacteria bacterium P01_H01_bin.74]